MTETFEKTKKQLQEEYKNHLDETIEDIEQEEDKNYIYLNQKKLWNITLNEITEEQVYTFKKYYFLPLLFLLYQNTSWITDLHFHIKGESEIFIQWRKDQILVNLELNDILQSVLEVYSQSFSSYFWANSNNKQIENNFENYFDEMISFIESELKRNFLVKKKEYKENLKSQDDKIEDKKLNIKNFWEENEKFYFQFLNTEYETKIFNNLIKNIYRLTWQNFTEFSTVSSSLRLSLKLYNFREEKWDNLDYRLEFVPTKKWTERSYYLVTRLLDTKDIKVKYWVYDDLVKSKLWGNWVTLIWWQTNSWKSTSIYSLLQELYEEKPSKWFFSIEDPIEKKLPFVQQEEVFVNEQDESKSFLIPDALKSFARSDTDVVFIGELRDKATIDWSIQLSSVWNALFTTFHISNFLWLKQRLQGMEVNPTALIDNLKILISQQLIPKYSSWLKNLDEAVDEKNYLLNSLKNYKNTWNIDAILEDFFDTVKYYEESIKANILYPESNYKENYKKLLDSLSSKENFANFIINNFYFLDKQTDKETNWMVNVYEVVVFDEQTKENFRNNSEKQYLADWHKTFLPIFVNWLILYQNELVNIEDIKELVY